MIKKTCSGVGVAAVLAAASVSAGQITDLGEFNPSSAQIVILGEVHDNALHHDGQADVVQGVQPAAVVYEMFTPAQARLVEALGVGIGPAALSDALDWDSSGWPGFEMYFPILSAAAESRIYGAALPPDVVRTSVSEGAAAQFGEGADRFGLADALPEEEQTERETGQADAHCGALPEELLAGFVEAQRLRDAHFSRVALMALEETGGPVVVITGNGHARTDWGMPAALKRAAPDVSVLALGQLESEPDEPPPFDLWRVTAPAEREDPCAAFR